MGPTSQWRPSASTCTRVKCFSFILATFVLRNNDEEEGEHSLRTLYRPPKHEYEPITPFAIDRTTVQVQRKLVIGGTCGMFRFES